MGRGQWVWARQRGQPKPPESEKTAITAACERFIADVLKPRYLPRIEPTSFNYPVDISGKWQLPTPLRLAGFAGSRAGWVVLSLSV
jgi:hypothetical protein